MESEKLARTIIGLLQDKKAQDILLLKLKTINSFTDYFIIATGSVDVHLKAIVDHVENSLASHAESIHPAHVEGKTNLFWVLLDFGDVVLHLFTPEARSYYQLETLWGDVPSELINDSTTNPISAG